MNAFSIEYAFSDLAIKVSGVDVGSFSGMALLIQDEGYDHFYVETITLDGDTFRNERTAIGGIRSRRVETKLRLSRPGLHERKETFAQHLFAAIEQSLYRDPDASEAFAQAVREEEFA